MTRDKVTWPGATVMKKNEGMPNYENNLKKGNLYIVFDIKFPRGTYSSEDQQGLCTCVLSVMVVGYHVTSGRYYSSAPARIGSDSLQWIIIEDLLNRFIYFRCFFSQFFPISQPLVLILSKLTNNDLYKNKCQYRGKERFHKGQAQGLTSLSIEVQLVLVTPSYCISTQERERDCVIESHEHSDHELHPLQLYTN